MRTVASRRPSTKPRRSVRASARQAPAAPSSVDFARTNVPALVASLKAKGVKLTVVGENVRVEAPRGTLNDLDQERLWQCLDGVRSVLAGGIP